jgi:pimeloyl-ACP methyl ester carboxylesterase
MADDTKGLMDALGIPKAHVIGVSMGGMIAQELVLNYPDKVRSLILCSTLCNVQQAVAETDPDFRNFVESAAAGQPLAPPPEEFLRLFFKWLFTPQYVETHRAALIQAQTAMQYPTPPHTLTRQGQAVLQHDVCHRLHEITVPVLVLHGEADILVPPLHAKILAEQIPHAELNIFPNTAHHFFEEIEEQAANTILDFLSHVEKSP